MATSAHTPKQLGQVLKGWRKSKRLTQREAADLVGLLPKTISKLELAPETDQGVVNPCRAARSRKILLCG